MYNKDEKRIMKAIYIPIILGAVIGLSFIAFWVWYLVTLPNLNEQLKYSPFYIVGQWESDDGKFVITSTLENIGNEEEGAIVVCCVYNKSDEESYLLELNYVSTRGFNHKYAAAMTASCQMPFSRYSCNYEFKQNEFTLKDLELTRGEGLLEAKSYHFTKVA